MATRLTAENRSYEPRSWERVPCPFCSCEASRVLERFGPDHRYTYVRCCECGLTYQNPRPSYDAEFVDTAYEVYSTSVAESWDGQKCTPRGEVVHREYTHILSEIEALLGRKGRILDVGCNMGFFCKAAKDAGWNPVGVEISETMVRVAREAFGVEAHAGDWTAMSLGAPFDAVYCSHVIEHIPDPGRWLEKFRGVLAPGGILCLSVPNMNSVDRRFKRVLKRLGLRRDHWEPWRTPDHLFEPCERSMMRFVRSRGWRILRRYTYPSGWNGRLSPARRFFHQQLRWGAKFRIYLGVAELRK